MKAAFGNILEALSRLWRIRRARRHYADLLRAFEDSKRNRADWRRWDR